jgi:glycerophosphoryl diester phosphodiesterase
MTLAEMRERCGYSPKGFSVTDQMATVPFELFERLFIFANGDSRLAEIFVDVKLRPHETDKARLIVEAVAAHRTRDDLEVALLLPQREVYEALAEVKLPPRVHLVPDFELPNVLEEAREIGARHISMGYSMRRTWGDFTRELAEVLAARDAGELERVITWTFNDEKRMRWLVEQGVDGIMTDDLPLLLKARGGSARAAASGA